MRWHCLQHVPFEGPGYLAAWVQSRGYALSGTNLWEQTTFPRTDEYDGLFILGGPMNAYEVERYSWLAPEQHFIARAVSERKPVLGICLGAQLLAAVLGGSVSEMLDKEIGWFPVELTPAGRDSAVFHDSPGQFMALHWHGDCFSIPPQAIQIARSAACEQQAFVYEDHVVGLQFHLELSQADVGTLIAHCGEDIKSGRYIEDSKSMVNCANHVSAAHRLLFGLLDSLSSHSVRQSSRPLAHGNKQRMQTATGQPPTTP